MNHLDNFIYHNSSFREAQSASVPFFSYHLLISAVLGFEPSNLGFGSQVDESLYHATAIKKYYLPENINS